MATLRKRNELLRGKLLKKLPVLPPRRPDSHKGDYGRILVLAGSRGMAGAAVLAGTAAMRAGAGLVTIGCPRSVYAILAAQVTTCTTRPFPETESETLSDRGRKEIIDFAAAFDVVALGPGLGVHASTARLVRHLATALDKPLVIDADGLNNMVGGLAKLASAPAPRIITPHPGEMARLLGLKNTATVQKARVRIALRCAKECDAVVVLKGHESVVTDGRNFFVNHTGNPGMATGGTGDVLTGVIAALLGGGMNPFAAAVLGTYVHGLAGDFAVARKGEVSLIATDVLDYLPEAFIALTTKRKMTRI